MLAALGFIILLNTPGGITMWQAQSQHFTCNMSCKPHNSLTGWVLTFMEEKTDLVAYPKSPKVIGWEFEPQYSDARCLIAL